MFEATIFQDVTPCSLVGTDVSEEPSASIIRDVL